MVLNYPPRLPGDMTGGPCYRCVFSKPPPADQVISCGDGGIVGPVVGVMGVLQALEAIKMITAGIDLDEGGAMDEFKDLERKEVNKPSLLIFSCMSTSPFRTVRLRSRRPGCFACSKKDVVEGSSSARLTRESLTSGSLDYVTFCGETSPVNLLNKHQRISAKDYAKLQSGAGKEHVLIDVREKVQFDICSLEGSVNVPFSEVQNGEWRNNEGLRSLDRGSGAENQAPIYVVCRLGNDSQVAAKKFMDVLSMDGEREVKDIEGGLRSWRRTVDGDWPDY